MNLKNEKTSSVLSVSVVPMAGHRLCVRLLRYSIVLVVAIVGYAIYKSLDLSSLRTVTPENLSSLPEKETNHRISRIESRRIEPDTSFRTDIKVPIILWWTPFTKDPGSFKKCGNVECFMTNDRKFANHPMMKVFLFYGTEFKLHDLPLPRQPHHEWALLHEESPKNVYLFSHEEIVTLFNHTATFKRESDYPITTMWLDSIEFLESKKYLVSTADKNRYQKEEGLAPLVYVQSDCGAPSDRDTFVKKLMQYIPVDSYGKCVHNKDLHIDEIKDPLKGMDHTEFYKVMAKYKFTITIENAICDDYITEKFWRPFHLGSVPVVYAADKLKDFFPTDKSVISARDFKTFQELATFILKLNDNDALYEQYLTHKKTGVPNQFLKTTTNEREWGHRSRKKPNPFNSFPCHLCKMLHEQAKLPTDQKMSRVAPVHHYGCPMPMPFSKEEDTMSKSPNDWFAQEWLWTMYQARAFRHYYDMGWGHNFTYHMLLEHARPQILEDWPKSRWLKIFERNINRGQY